MKARKAPARFCADCGKQVDEDAGHYWCEDTNWYHLGCGNMPPDLEAWYRRLLIKWFLGPTR